MAPDLKIQRAAMAAAAGLFLFGGTIVYAEHRADPSDRVISDGERTDSRHSDLRGGFYEDRYKSDDWFYDFYDSPGGIRVTDPERARTADAVYPWVATRSAPRSDQNAQNRTFQRYYNDPWFYEQQDPAYAMPLTRVRDGSYVTTPRRVEFVEGRIVGIKQLRNRTSGGQNTVALLNTQDNRKVITDLGPIRETVDLALTQGDTIQVEGQWEDVGPYPVLMAHRMRSGVNRVSLNRDRAVQSSDYWQAEGRVDQLKDIPTAPTGRLHRTAAIQTADGRFALVDLGPVTPDNVSTKAGPGDRIVATGPVVQVGRYPILFADRMSVNDGAPIDVARSDEVEPASLPFEHSQQSTINPSCVGGGCEGASVNRMRQRELHSNAMDGTIR